MRIRQMRKRVVVSSVMLLLFFMVSGYSFAGGDKEPAATEKGVSVVEGEPKYGGRLIYSTVSEIETVDEHFAQQLVTQGVLSNVYEGLVGHDEYLNLKPQLATSWDVSEDGRTYTFHLRKGVMFHHGREMEAKDVKFSIERVLNPQNAASNRAGLMHVKKVEVVDKYTVKFYLANSDAAFPAKLSQQATIMPYDVTKAVGRIEIGDTISGTGPFKLVEWKKDDYTLFKKFDSYWGEGLPYVDEVMIKIIPDANVRLAALRAGDIDIMEWIPP
jgi:peptide/nickel transport system substrate-binding protein